MSYSQWVKNNSEERIVAHVYEPHKVACERQKDTNRNLLEQSIALVQETNLIAEQTSQDLMQQTETLERIERNADLTSNILDNTEYIISGMKSLWTSLSHSILPFTKPKLLTEESLVSEKKPVTYKQPAVPSKTSNIETDDLDRLSNMLSELHVRSVSIGETISHHNSTIDSIKSKTAKNAQKVKQQHHDLKLL